MWSVTVGLGETGSEEDGVRSGVLIDSGERGGIGVAGVR
jgi:hypothetical protein